MKIEPVQTELDAIPPVALELPPGPLGRMRARVQQVVGSRFSRELLETLGTRVFLLGVTTLMSIVIARILGPDGRGYYAVAMAVSGMGVQLGNLGLHASNTYNIARDRTLLARLLANSLLVGLGLGGAGALAAMVVFRLWPGIAPVWGWVMVLSLAAVPFSLAYLLGQSLLLGLREVRAYNLIDAGTTLLSVAVVGVLIATGFVSVTTLLAAAVVVAMVACAWTTLRLARNIEVVQGPSWPLFVSTLRYGVKAYLAALFAYLAQRFDVLIVQRMLDSEAAGYYAVAVSVSTILLLFPSVLGSLLFPKLSGMSGRAERWSMVRRTALTVLLAMGLLSLVTAVLAPWIVNLLFGAAFAPAVQPLRWLLPGVAMMAANSVLMNYFAADGMPRFAVFVWVGVVAADVTLSILLIPKWGLVGAAIASTIAYTGLLLACVVYAWTNRRAGEQ